MTFPFHSFVTAITKFHHWSIELFLKFINTILNIFKKYNPQILGLSLINITCLVYLSYNVIHLIEEYLLFNTAVKLQLTEDKSGSRLPSITICTESLFLYREKTIEFLENRNQTYDKLNFSLNFQLIIKRNEQRHSK